MFFFTVYSLGLRLSEGLALRVADIDAQRARVHIRDSKGNRDRFVPLPVATLDALRRFWATRTHYRPPTCPRVWWQGSFKNRHSHPAALAMRVGAASNAACIRPCALPGHQHRPNF